MAKDEQSQGDRGFTMLEVLFVLAAALVLMAVALPTAKNYRITAQEMSGAKSIVSQIVLAKMRAASNFSWAELYCGTTTYNDGSSNSTCQVKLNSAATGNTTFSGTNSGDINGQEPLPPSLHFGFGSIAVGAGRQSSPAQPNSASPPYQIIFNSRGVAIDTSGNPKSDYALYLYSDMGRYYAISVELTGKPRLWQWNGSQWTEID
jgi:prepilin-type N-terminal cleavage/methylation domain-containing protein